MKKNVLNLGFVIMSLISITVLASCSDDDNDNSSSDVRKSLQVVPSLSNIAAGDYHFVVYSSDSTLYQGYNEVYFALENSKGEKVSNFTISNITPIMDMGTMKHSTPIGHIETVSGQNVYKTWIAFLMYSGQMNGSWSLDFDYTINGVAGHASVTPQVAAYPENSRWLQGFSIDGTRHFLTLVSPRTFKEGSNIIKAYFNKVDATTDPYLITDGSLYKVEIDPRMPDMGNHTSPNNVALTWNSEKQLFEGTLNLTMTGFWRINLKLTDLKGNIIAGTDVTSTDATATGGSSSLYWDINI